MAAIRHTCYSDARNSARKEDQCLLGVCRIRRKVTDQRRAVTRGCGFLVKGMIIPDPAPSSSEPCCNRSYQYSLLTTSQVIDASDPLENFFVEFQKLNKKLKRVPLKKIADIKDVLRTRNLVLIPVKPSREYPEKKDSIFTYRPFKVTSVNQSHEELECFFVEDKEKSFDVIPLRIQCRVAQNSRNMYFQISDDSIGRVYTTFPHKENRKPYGGVILKRLKNQDDKFFAAGCLIFADDGSLCPVFFPLPPTDTCQDGPQVLNGTSSGERASGASHLGHETPVCTAVVTTPAPLPDSGAGATVVTATTTTTATVTVTPATLAPVSVFDTTVTVTAASDHVTIATAAAAVGTTAITGVSATTAFSSDTVTHTSAGIPAPSVITAGPGEEAVSQVENSLPSLTPHPIQEQEVESRDTTEDTTQAGMLPQEEAGNAYENPLDTSQDGSQLLNGTSSGERGITAPSVITAGPGEEAVSQVENSLPSLTPHPIQEQEVESRDAEDTTPAGTLPQEEAGNKYKNLLVSEKLVLPEYKELYDKLVCALDNTAHPAIANWEHLACVVDAPSLVRLKCKLSTNYSHTQMLLEVLAVRENKEVVIVKDLIDALGSIGRNEIVKMITDVHHEDKISPKPIKDFMDCASNQDLLDRIITGLDDQTSQVKKHWKHLGFKLGIPKKKLEVIELCAPVNPTKGLMEYLLSAEQNLTVGKFDEKVRQKFRHLNVLTILEPLLKVGSNQDKLMKDVIDLDNEYMDAFYVRLNKIIPGIENWKDLARAFGIPRDVYKNFNPKEPRSPTRHLFEWLFVNRTELTVGQLCSALERIKRNDLVGDVKKCFGQCFS